MPSKKRGLFPSDAAVGPRLLSWRISRSPRDHARHYHRRHHLCCESIRYDSRLGPRARLLDDAFVLALAVRRTGIRGRLHGLGTAAM